MAACTMASLLRLPRLVSVGLPGGLLTRISVRCGLRRTGEAALPAPCRRLPAEQRAAVDLQDLAGDEVGARRGEVADRGGDVLGSPGPPGATPLAVDGRRLAVRRLRMLLGQSPTEEDSVAARARHARHACCVPRGGRRGRARPGAAQRA